MQLNILAALRWQSKHGRLTTRILIDGHDRLNISHRGHTINYIYNTVEPRRALHIFAGYSEKQLDYSSHWRYVFNYSFRGTWSCAYDYKNKDYYIRMNDCISRYGSLHK